MRVRLIWVSSIWAGWLVFGVLSCTRGAPPTAATGVGAVQVSATSYQLRADSPLFVRYSFTNRTASPLFIGHCGFRRGTVFVRGAAPNIDTLPAPVCFAVLVPPESLGPGDSLSDSAFVGPILGYSLTQLTGAVRLFVEAYTADDAARGSDRSRLVPDSLRRSATFAIEYRP